MADRFRWIMRRADSIAPQAWVPGAQLLTQHDLDECIPGYVPVNRLTVEDLRVLLCMAQANHAIHMMIHPR